MADFSSFFSTSPDAGGPQQISPLNDPGFNELYGATRNLIPTSLPSLQDLVGGGVNSPLIQAIIGPALARLMGTEQTSRDAVTDMFRSAGGLRGTAYGQAAARNENNIMQNRGNLISDTIAKNLATLVSGQLGEQRNMMLPGEEYTNLLRLLRPDVVSPRGSTIGGGFGSSSPSIGPSIFDPGYDAMIADWQRRMNPTYGGFAGTGVNNPITTPAPVPQPYYDPGGISGGGPSGGYAVTNNNGTWVSDPFASGGYNTGNGAIGYQQAYDEFGNPVSL